MQNLNALIHKYRGTDDVLITPPGLTVEDRGKLLTQAAQRGHFTPVDFMNCTDGDIGWLFAVLNAANTGLVDSFSPPEEVMRILCDQVRRESKHRFEIKRETANMGKRVDSTLKENS